MGVLPLKPAHRALAKALDRASVAEGGSAQVSSVMMRSVPGGADAMVKLHHAGAAAADELAGGTAAKRDIAVPLVAAKSTLRPLLAQMSIGAGGAEGAPPPPAASRGVGVGVAVVEGVGEALGGDTPRLASTSAPLKPRLLLEAAKASVTTPMPPPLSRLRGCGSRALVEAHVVSSAPPAAEPLYTVKAAAPGSTASASGVSVRVKPGTLGSPSREKVQVGPAA